MRRHARAQSRLSRLTRSCTEPGLSSEECPSVYDCYRFATKLGEHKHLLDAYVVRVLSGLRAVTPETGPDVVVGGSGLPPMPTDKVRQQGGGERAVAADPDASWGHRSAVLTRKGGARRRYALSPRDPLSSCGEAACDYERADHGRPSARRHWV